MDIKAALLTGSEVRLHRLWYTSNNLSTRAPATVDPTSLDLFPTTPKTVEVAAEVSGAGLQSGGRRAKARAKTNAAKESHQNENIWPGHQSNTLSPTLAIQRGPPSPPKARGTLQSQSRKPSLGRPSICTNETSQTPNPEPQFHPRWI